MSHMNHNFWIILQTVYFPLFTSYDSSILSQLQDRILSAFYVTTHWLSVSSRTVYFLLFTSYDSLIMSQLKDRILTAFYIVWLIVYESAPGPYTFRQTFFRLVRLRIDSENCPCNFRGLDSYTRICYLWYVPIGNIFQWILERPPSEKIRRLSTVFIVCYSSDQAFQEHFNMCW